MIWTIQALLLYSSVTALVRTCHYWLILHLSMTYCGLILHLSMTYCWLILHLSVTCCWLVLHLSMTYCWLVLHLSMTYCWLVLHLSMTYCWLVLHLPVLDTTSLCIPCTLIDTDDGRPVGHDFLKYLPWFLEDNPGITCPKGLVLCVHICVCGHLVVGCMYEPTKDCVELIHIFVSWNQFWFVFDF